MDPNTSTRTWQGFREFLPVGLVIFSYAVVFGILAVNSGLGILETCAMSLTVFAGASQFMALPMIQSGASIWALTAMALVVNMRHLLYGLNIGQKYSKSRPAWLLGLSFGIVDETYAFNTLGPGRNRTSIQRVGAGRVDEIAEVHVVVVHQLERDEPILGRCVGPQHHRALSE